MKHPVFDRILMLLSAIGGLCATALCISIFSGHISLETVSAFLTQVGALSLKTRVLLIVVAVVFAVYALLMLAMMLPGRKKRSSSFAIQRNENGMVRISLKALETLVQKCLNQHAELKVVTSSLYSDEETVRVDVHITLQSDISMPLAISALQKQIKKYIEACSGVMVQEVRVFVDGTTPATEETAKSPYAIPASLIGLNQEALPVAESAAEQEVPAAAAICEEADSPAQEDEAAHDDAQPESEQGEEQKDQGEGA
ncbi:MAG: alkaline shock response membrane anchor protein AmaP [Clostridia bacterium]|nr:alkaline shock response membrane anchor protein AmaP [Clostridia bacterium]